jgi:hypothetical protein
MEITHQRIDLEACRRHRHTPQTVIKRSPNETWCVPTSPVLPAGNFGWSYCRSEELVQIPLVPYLLKEDPDLALAFMLAIGVRAARDIQRPVRRIHIATGVPMEQFGPDEHGYGMRLFVGFGLLLE